MKMLSGSYLLKFCRSAFFWFCNDERSKVKMLNPEYGVGDIAKELGKKWSDAGPELKGKYEAMAEKDKARYERVSIPIFERPRIERTISRRASSANAFFVSLQEMTAYKKKQKDGPGVCAPPVPKKAESEEEDGWEEEDE